MSSTRAWAHRLAIAALGVSLVSCRDTAYHFDSPKAPQGPPAFVGPGAFQTPPHWDAPPAAAGLGNAARTASPVFVKTADSNEWVTKTFVLQARYRRVLVVQAGGIVRDRITAPAPDLNALPGQERPTSDYPVAQTFRTLQEAANAAQGGDLVAVMPGHYAGFAIGDKADAGDGRYIHFRAMGAAGEVVVDSPNAEDPNWMILIQRAHHVILEGFTVAGSNDDAGSNPHGPNGGIFLDGDFGQSSKEAHHLAIVSVYSHHHKMWGLHSTDTHTVLIQDSLFAFSAREHGAYVSDGSDNYVIRRNVFYGNRASGLQCNVDPLASLEETMKNPGMRGYSRMQSTHAWAEGALRYATERFGLHNFPDGRGYNFLIEANVMNRNGARGGAALNMAGVRESIIQNNLAYDNLASGIVLWDNANPFDAELVSSPPASPAQMVGPQVLPTFGCYGDIVRANTILAQTKGRPALLVGAGSWGTRAYDNILINDADPSIELTATGTFRTDAGWNVINTVSYDAGAAALKATAINLPDTNRTVVGTTKRELAGEFERSSDEPWVLFEGGTYRLNPNRPDFRPKKRSRLLAGQANPRELPPMDLLGKRRAGADVGAFGI